MKTISIIGLGWLGKPLAEKLQQKGFTVKGSTTDSTKLETLQKKASMPVYLNSIHIQKEKVSMIFLKQIYYL